MTADGPDAPERLDALHLFDRVSSVASAGLGPALDELATQMRGLLEIDVVIIQVVDEHDPEEIARGYSCSETDPGRSLRGLLTPSGIDPIGLADAAVEAGATVRWSRLWAGPDEMERLARLAEAGQPADAIHRAMADANGVAVPLRTAYHPHLGAITLLNLGHGRPVPDELVRELEALVPELSLAVRNYQLAARGQRTRRTLEAVVGSSRVGILVTDPRGRVTVANDAVARLLGTSRAELVGQPVRELARQRIKWRFANPEEFELRVVPLYDDPVAISDQLEDAVTGQVIRHYSAPARDEGGAVLGRVDVFTDVTEAQEALRAARRLAEERTELLEREERRAAEEMALSRAGHMMASAMSLSDIHEHLLEQAEELVKGCEKSAVLVTDAGGDVLPAATHGFAPSTVQRMVFRVGEGIVGRVLANRRPFICNDTSAEARVASRIVRPEGIRSFMHIPLVLGERVYGLFSVNSTRPRAFGERELRVLSDLARHAAAALQNALQFEQERHIAETLQNALLSEDLPQVEGLQLGALYQASAGSQVGGDLYNVWTLPDGRVAVLVGDVSGKGVEAAGVTAMVRYTTEGLSLHQQDPSRLVGELNDLLWPRLPDASLVTMVLAVIDPVEDTMSWCSAGHPPALLVTDGRQVRPLEDPDPPCGAFPDSRFRTHNERFAPGDLLFLHTDGLIEARRGELEFGERGVHQALLEAVEEPPNTLARSVYAAARVWCEGRLNDDVAIAVVRRGGSPSSPGIRAA